MKKTDTNLPQAAAPADPFVTIAFIHDRTGPQTSGIEEGMRTDESRPTVTGTSTPNQRVMLYDGDRLIGSVQANSSGYWVFNFPFGEFLAPGDHQLSAKIPGATSDKTSFTVDPQAKYNLLIDFFYPQANPSLMLGESSIISEIAVRGRTKPGELVEIYDGDKLVGSGYANGAGEYHIAINEPLSVGAHTLRAKSASGQSVDKLYTLTPPPPADYLEITAVEDEKGQPVAEGEANLTRCPTFFGKTLPFTSVEIWDGAQLLGSAMSNFHGEWRFDLRQPLAGGTHTIAAKTAEGSTTFTLITDAPPAPAVPVIEQVFDDVGAETGALTMGAETDDRQPQLLGTAEPNRFVAIYDNGREIGRFRTDARGEWQFTLTAPLAVGTHSLTVGYPGGAQSEPFPITVTELQLARPVITALYDDVGSGQGAVGAGGSTDDRQPQLLGTAEPNRFVAIYDNGREIGRFRTDARGEWQYTLTAPLAVGAHSLTVGYPGGAQSEPFPITVTELQLAPTVITALYDDVGSGQGAVGAGGSTDDRQPQLLGTAEPNRFVAIYDNGRELSIVRTNSRGEWQYTLTAPLAVGTHSLTVGYPGGAQSEPFPITVTELQLAPAVITALYDSVGSEQGAVGAGGSTDDRQPQLLGTAEPNRLVGIYNNERLIGLTMTDARGEWQFMPTVPLAAGAHSLTVGYAYPHATQSEPFPITVTELQLAEPVITALYDDVGSGQGAVGAGGSTDDRQPQLQGTAEPNRFMAIYDNGREIGRFRTDARGEWQYTLTAPLAVGTHSLTVGYPGGAQSEPFPITVTELQLAPAVITALYDSVGSEQGAVGAGGSTDDRQPQLLGTAEPNRLVGIYDNERLIGLTMTDARGEWQFMPTVPLAAGAHSLTVGYAYPHATQSEPFPITVTEPQIARPVITALYDDVGSEQGIIGNGKSTDDRKPLLSGTAPAGSWINIMDNGKAIGYVQANSSGEWQFTVPSSLTLGEHRFTLKIDSVESEPYTVTVTSSVKDEWLITGAYDSVGAETGLVINGGTTDDRYPEFTGRAPAYSFVQVHSERGLVAYAWADEKGEWRAKANFPLPRGEIAFVMEAENKHSELFTLKIVGEPLALVLDKVYHGDIIDSVTLIEEGATTSPGYFYLLGKGDPGSVVNIFDGATLAAAVTVDSFGFWQLDKSILMVSEGGNHTLSIAYADGSQRVEFDVTIDDSLSLMNVLQQPEELLLMEAVALDDDALLPLQISDGELRQQPESLAGPAGTPVVSPMLEEEALNPHAVNSY